MWRLKTEEIDFKFCSQLFGESFIWWLHIQSFSPSTITLFLTQNRILKHDWKTSQYHPFKSCLRYKSEILYNSLMIWGLLSFSRFGCVLAWPRLKVIQLSIDSVLFIRRMVMHLVWSICNMLIYIITFVYTLPYFRFSLYLGSCCLFTILNDCVDMKDLKKMN